MIDKAGVEWLPTLEAATRLGVDPATMRAWVSRAKVKSAKIDGRRWVRMPDAMDAERATRGQFLAQRGG